MGTCSWRTPRARITPSSPEVTSSRVNRSHDPWRENCRRNWASPRTSRGICGPWSRAGRRTGNATTRSTTSSPSRRPACFPPRRPHRASRTWSLCGRHLTNWTGATCSRASCGTCCAAGPPGMRPPGRRPTRSEPGRGMKFGAHVSISGHIHLAIDRAVAIGCECLQIFVGNPRQWRHIEYAAADVVLFREKRARAGLDPVVAHSAYLINLASPDDAFYARSVASLIASVDGIARLGGLGVITHIGSRMGLSLEAGAGGAIGGTFEELAAILDALEWHPRLGVCLDTAHLFAAGFDIRTVEGVARTLRTFDRTVGLRHLRAVHLNDSKAGLSSHLDRHENIGAGQIGAKGFRALLHHRVAERLPGFIETPGFDRRGADRKNLEILKRLRRLGPPGVRFTSKRTRRAR